MTEEEIIVEILERRKAREDLHSYICYTKADYKDSLFAQLVCAAIDQFILDCQAGKRPILVLQAPPQHGKQIENGTPILTIDGWKTHGELIPGDGIFAPDGSVCRVVATSEESPSNCRVELTDGSVFYCHENHEWAVRSRDLKREVVLSAREMTKVGRRSVSNRDPLLVSGSRGVRGSRFNYQLPHVQPIMGESKVLPVSPYSLGAWLGDGTRVAARISGDAKDAAILNGFVEEGYSIKSQWTHKVTSVLTTSFVGLWGDLKNAGVWVPKHIPDVYFSAPLADRLQLLAGLIDTDGYVYQKNGRTVFTTAEKSLADSVAQLVATFGWRATVVKELAKTSSSGIVGTKDYWVVGFNPTMAIPCRLERKQIKVLSKRRRVAIRSIEFGDWGKKGRCIQIDREDGMYLVGHSLTPTHNSEIVSRRLAAYLMGRFPDWRIASITYSDDLSSSLAQDVRRGLASEVHKKLFPAPLLKDKYARHTITEFNSPGGSGSYLGVGIGGGITGRPVDCFVAGTMVQTNQGEKPIEDLNNIDSSCKILAYRNGKLEYARLKAFAVSSSVGIYRLTFASGRFFESTGDHPVYCGGRYIKAASLSPGDSVLRSVRDEKNVSRIRDFEEMAQGSKRNILLDRLRSKEFQTRSTLQTMRDRFDWRYLRNVLQFKMSPASRGSNQTPAAPNALLDMQKGIRQPSSRSRSIRSILFSGLRERSPFGSYEETRQSEMETQLYGTARIQSESKRVSQNTTLDPRKRFSLLRSLRSAAEIACASYRRASDQQRPDQPGYGLREMPLSNPCADGWRVETDRVVGVEKIREGAVTYDIQVESAANFFANGILVHNCGIIDDPTKNETEALSPTTKERHWNWYQSGFTTRMSQNSGQIIMATSWAQDDLVGRILTQYKGNKRLTHLRFPAINDPGQIGFNPVLPLGALVPELHSLEKLIETMNGMSDYWWSALFQQSPKILGGNIFKDRFAQYYLPKDLPETFDKVIASWDCTFKETTGTDYVVGQVWGKKGANSYLLDQVRDRMSFTRTVKEVIAQKKKWPQIREILIEDKANGPAVIDTLKAEVSGIIPIEPDGSKEARAHAVTAYWEAGNVWLPHEGLCSWVIPYLAELTIFPAGANDDQVDGTTQALRRLYPLRGRLQISQEALNKMMGKTA